jgi:hypothetical protein
MPGKKAHKPAIVKGAGTHGARSSGKRVGQTPGQFARDPKGRKGQFGGAGDAPLTKK